MNGFFQTAAIYLILGGGMAPAQTAQTYNNADQAKAPAPASTATRIVFLGTGMPAPNPKRQGPSFVIQTGGKTYLFDIGVGVVRQAAAAGVNVSPPTAAFLSHLHTDHTLGLPDLMFTPWSSSGANPSFHLYGPVGLQWMVTNIQTHISRIFASATFASSLAATPIGRPS